MIQVIGSLLMALFSGAMFLLAVSFGSPGSGRKQP
jgi:hypothetical protein